MRKKLSIIKTACIFMLALGLPHMALAQMNTSGQSLIVANSSDTINRHVRIKWFIPEIYPRNGVNIYRRVPGQANWQKINDKPFVKGDYTIPGDEYLKDTSLQNYINLVNELTEEELKGLTLAMILIKGIQNVHYARYIGIEYHDTDVSLGDQYQYRVTKITPGGEQQIGVTAPITVKQFTPHAPPANLQVKAGDAQVLLKWQPDKRRFYGVNIFRRRGDEDYVKINPVPVIMSKRRGKDGVLKYPDTFFTDDSLANGVTYLYKVAGLDYFGRSSAYTQAIKVVPKDKTAPLSPKYLKCKVDLMQVQLSWQNRFSPDLAGINIYRSVHHDAGFKKINKDLLDRRLTEYTDKVAKPGKYYYYVAAVDSSGNEGESFLTMANVMDIYPPEAPGGLYAQADTGSITLHWQPNTEADLLGYQVYRTVDKDDEDRYVLLNATPVALTTFVDSLPATAKNKFHYRVAALDSAYNRSEFSDFAAKSMPDIVPPAQPFIKDVSITENNYLQVHWIPNADADLKGYHVYRISAQDSSREITKLNESLIQPVVRQFTDRWVEQGVTYHYSLQAVDSAGNPSEYANPFPGVLPVVKEKLADDLFHYIRVKQKGDYNLVRWDVQMPDEALGVIVYRKSREESFKPLTGLMQGNKYKDSDITPGDTYEYEIRLYHKTLGECRSEVKQIVVPEQDE